MKTFAVRGRPVGFQPGCWGGALVAVERGHFPVSGTGYRSLTGLCGGHGEAAAPEISPEFLEELAANQDRERRSTLAAVRRPRPPGPDPLSNYITASGDADRAFEEGFFAPESERVTLWGGAYRLFCLIESDPRFQPMPSAPAWTAEHCAQALAAHGETLRLLRELALGQWPGAPLRRHLSASAYFALPPKPEGEHPFALPATPLAFAFDLSAPAAEPTTPREPRPRPSAVHGDEAGSRQLPLF